jgi:hypothetical protein
MRTRQLNRSLIVVAFIVITIALVFAHRNGYVRGRDSPGASKHHSAQTSPVGVHSRPPDIHPSRAPGAINPDITLDRDSPDNSIRQSAQTSPVEVRSGPPDIYPDPTRTPGATNPEITPDNIRENICSPNWSTKLIRPPVGYTNRLKTKQIQEYGEAGTNPRDYEEDHLIPLEIGGDPTDPRNLWPEPYDTSIPDGGARFKDKVENYLHKQVCAGDLTLDEAQREIVNDWYRVYTTFVRQERSER